MSVSGSPEANNRQLQQAPGSAARRRDQQGQTWKGTRKKADAPVRPFGRLPPRQSTQGIVITTNGSRTVQSFCLS
jgi:hypothetical protein